VDYTPEVAHTFDEIEQESDVVIWTEISEASLFDDESYKPVVELLDEVRVARSSR
jgi:hypothetical protein